MTGEEKVKQNQDFIYKVSIYLYYLCSSFSTHSCLRWFATFNVSLVCVCVTKAKQNDTLLMKKRGSTKSLCRSLSQHIRRQE